MNLNRILMGMVLICSCTAAAAEESFVLLDSSGGSMGIQAFFSRVLDIGKAASLPDDLAVAVKKGDLPAEGVLAENCAVVCEDLRKYDAARFDRAAYGLLPVVVAVSKDSVLENISIEDLQRIYSGRVNNWSRLGGSDQKVHIAGSSLQNAIGRGFRKLVMQQDIYGGKLPDASGLVKPDMLLCRNAAAAAAVLQVVPGPIVFGSWRLAENKEKKYKVLKINNVAPTLENIVSRRYPLVVEHFLSFNKGSMPARLPEIMLFLRKNAQKSGVYVVSDIKK